MQTARRPKTKKHGKSRLKKPRLRGKVYGVFKCTVPSGKKGMKMKTVPTTLCCGCLLLFSFSAGGGAREKQFDPRRPTAQKYGSVRIRVRQVTPRGAVSGTPVPDERVPELAERFFRALNRLPAGFVAKSGLRYVTFVTGLRLNNAPAAGVASGETIWLAEDCGVHTIYHELYHIFDPPGKNKQWLRLNPRGFVYTGSEFRKEKLSKFKRRRMSGNLEENRYKDDFVSRYAMSNEQEDRAETFAAMVVEGNKFLLRTEKSPVMKKKMEYIIDATDRRNLLGKDFWINNFHMDAQR